MKVGAIPQGPIERLADWLGYVPRPLLETVDTMFASRMIMAGVRFGIFEHLADRRSRSLAEIAADLRLHEPALGFLLRGLAALGYLEQSDGRFHNSPTSDRFLVRSSPSSVADFVVFNYDQWEMWSGIEDTLRSGERLDVYKVLAGGAFETTTPAGRRLREYVDEQGGPAAAAERATRGLRDVARFQSREIYLRLWLPNSIRSLVDIAGGHGGYSIAFCRRYPALRATVIELPETARIGRKIVEEEGLSDRISFTEGDLHGADIGRDRDVVFFFNIAHHLSDDENCALFRRALGSLAPGGRFVVMDMFEELGAKNFMASAFGLFFQRTSGARTYRAEVLAGWLREAGYSSVWSAPLLSSGSTSGLVVGKR